MRFLLIATALSFAALPAHAQEKDEAGARAAVNHYLAGHATGSAAEFSAAFHPKAMLYWNRDGAFAERTLADFIAAAATGKPAADEAQRKRSIESLDVTGNVGMAKVVLDYPAVRFVDYLSLVKADGEWRIVNKIFQAERKANQGVSP
ncbi:nuclear transport factor 2 family protein [Sphingomonas sp. OTU376]|uniref:nuclear transport factor 2 family protein n=1 Tax=Sphingomonas sp. OTU376 TaxID=3043863 RepID=UPI00313B0453